MKGFYLILLAVLAGGVSCSDRDSDVVLTAHRITTFTGRGNRNEPLLKLTAAAETCRIGGVTVSLQADPGNVEMLHLTMNDQLLGSVRVVSGKKEYKIACRAEMTDSSDLIIGADIAADATEGGFVGADIEQIRINGKRRPVEAPTPGHREILLCRTRVFSPGDYGSRNYRIPAICTLPDGSLLTATDKRKFNQTDLPEDIDIVACRSLDGGHTWSEPVTIAEGKGYGKGFGDAVLVVTAEGNVVCGFSGGTGLWKSTPENPQQNWISISSDLGQTWSAPVDVTAMQWGPEAVNPECRDSHSAFFGSGHGLLLTREPYAGRILFVTAVATRDNRLDNYAFWSDDGGKTWQISTMAYRDGDEAKVVELSDGRILMSVRQNGARGWNISEDGGKTWGTQQRWTDIVTNACNGDIIRHNDEILLHSLPNSMERKNVSIFMSFDEGKTWPKTKTLCPYESVYSSLTLLPDGTIGAYIEENPTGDCEMWFLSFSLDWLRK
ncbi:MAG: exo-alpha-sialidase [Bacteroidales bacterium]|jgi:sialidase-1|nr:exo-alpha-sialidase [Bacteroidales bacterium]